MSTFNLPTQNAKSAFTITKFGGVDFCSSPENVHKSRSSACINMIKDKNGSLRKRMGYERIGEPFSGRINGALFWKGKHLIHAGTSLYSLSGEGEAVLLCEGLKDGKSRFVSWGDRVYIITGEGIYYLTEKGVCASLTENAYIPTVIISKAPEGGGTLHEDYNLLSKRWFEQFLSDGESTVYRLEKKDLSDVKNIWIRDENGGFALLSPSEYTVNLTEGTVTFNTAPPLSPVTGMDNVIIEGEKDEGTEEMITHCTVGVIYGSGDMEKRLFLGGNKNHKGMDFFSSPVDHSYFPHMNYSSIDDSDIVGYSVSNGSLYTHMAEKTTAEDSRIIKRDAVTAEDGKAFVISGEFSAPSLISPYSTLDLNGEALYLSRKGVYAITVSDVTGEKICQLRSAFLGDVFSDFTEEEMKNAHCAIFGNYYILSLGDKMFLLDGEGKSYFSGTPLCSFQYECYYFENIPANVLWTDGIRVYFGSDKGNVYGFFTDKTVMGSYTDDGEAVSCVFETSEISDGVFFKKKTYVSVSAKIGSFLNTGVKIFARTDGKWHDKPVLDSMGRGRYFDFSYVDFESVSFSSNRSEVTICGKVRIRNTDSVRFRITNDKAEPFSLLAFGAEYVQKGNYY